MNFINALKNNLNKTTTFNGANAIKSTSYGLVDLFGVAGAVLLTISHHEMVEI